MTGTPIRDEQWVWRLDQMGQVPFNPPNVSGWEGGTAWLSTSSIRARFDAATAVLNKTDQGRLDPAHPDAGRRRSPRPIAATGRPRVGPATARAMRRYAAQRGGRPHREVGGRPLLPRAPARAAAPAAGRPRRPGLLRRPPLSRGCRDHRATRRAFMGRAAEVVPVPADALDGLAAFERSGGMTRRDLLERGVGLWVGAVGDRRAHDARPARGRLGPGPVGARRDDPGLALPRRRQRRPQHARPAGRPALPRAAPAPGRRPRDHAAAARRPRVRLAPGRSRACARSTTRARSRCCRRSTSPTPTSRTSTRSPTGGAGSWASPTRPPAGWGGRSTPWARATTRSRGSASPGRPTRC